MSQKQISLASLIDEIIDKLNSTVASIIGEDGQYVIHIIDQFINSDDTTCKLLLFLIHDPRCLLLGIIVNYTNATGLTALHIAATKSSAKIFRAVYDIFVQHNRHLDLSHRNCSVLHSVLLNRSDEFVLEFLSYADEKLLFIVGPQKQTPFHLAIHSGLIRTCEYLYPIYVRTGHIFSLRDGGISVLMYAIQYGRSAIVDILLSDSVVSNKLLDTLTDDGNSPFHHICKLPYPDICQTIYNKLNISQLCLQTRVNSHTGLHIAVLAGNSDIINVLLSDKANALALVVVKDINGLTALDLAQDSPEIYDLILSKLWNLVKADKNSSMVC